MVVDAKTYGNVARFMNHSCDGNLIKKVGATQRTSFRGSCVEEEGAFRFSVTHSAAGEIRRTYCTKEAF